MPKLCCFAFLLLTCFGIAAQEHQTVFTNYNAKHGLPQSSIYGITQDKNGFIWVGTADGLCRFDGYRFTTYKMNAEDSTAISSYKEFRFYNDSIGRLWIVHFNGISLYDEKKDRFINILVYTPKNVVIAESHFYGEDKNYIWVGLCDYGIVKVDKHTLKAHHTPLTRTTHRANTMVHYQGFLEYGKLWITDNNETAKEVFYTWDIVSGKTDTLPIPIRNLVNMNDSIMLGIDNKLVYQINKKTLAYQTIPVYSDRRDHNAVHIYRKTAHEAILSSATNGIFFVDIHKKKITGHIAITDPSNPQSFLYARSVCEDRSGNLWIGTRGDGVEKMRFPFKKFRSYHIPKARNNVFGLAADRENIYAGLQAQGITKFSLTDTSVHTIAINKNFPQALNSAYTIKPFGPDKLIIIANSSENNGSNIPFLYTKATRKIELLSADVQRVFKQYWGRGNLRHFLYREGSGKYITNIGEYLVSLNPCRDNTLCPELITKFASENLTCGFTDSDGSRWVGTFTGVFKFHAGKWQRVPLPTHKEIKTMCSDPDGNIWMGTNDEIFVLDRSLKTLHHYTERKELSNGHIYTIIRDNHGNMWFSHNEGISVYYWKEKRFAHFNEGDGLPSPEYNIHSSFKKEDGELFFGGINGVTAFYPDEIKQNTHTSEVKITGIRIFDEPLKTDTPYWNIRTIRLPYTENSISFEFSLLEYTNEAKNSYQFKMDGVDNRWINAGDRRFTRYGGLGPGHYTFQVRGANSDGVWGPVSSIAITIVPPFWQTTWFIILAIMAAVALFLGAGILIQKVRQRKTIRALELQHKIQLERERISRDLHDNVGTQLSLISKNLENIIDPTPSTPEPDRLRNLQHISQTSKQVIFTLRETIWALNREEISVEELSDKLKAFTQKIIGTSHCHLEFKEQLEYNVALGPSEAIHLFRICQEAIANSLKYAEATQLNINISTGSAGKYGITISDNGIGFDMAARQTGTHYGLDNMRYRAAEIHCDFLVESLPGKGTTVTIARK